ncbi:MAG: bifunctional diaminohydroxyphosphoribosylaminopyrimidine deaminase/5-amino-6-(5-phosphoribosylamino)uracil reductase RibD [Methyloligellaceae bacterium]
MGANDTDFMRIALRLARRGLGRAWPNPSVGAVIVQESSGEIVGRGWTQPGGRPHAEVVALEEAQGRAQGATLYVTLEPCAHHGQTPPCADAIIAAGVRRVICAIEDPDPRVRSAGLRRLTEAGIEVATGTLGDEAHRTAQGHILRITLRRPFVQLKLAVGSDGRMAPGDGAPVWVTGEAARAQAHMLRARADAILVGRGTVAADNPSLTCRLPGMAAWSPVRIVLDSALRTPETAKLLSESDLAPTWLVCGEGAPQDRQAALEGQGGTVLRAPADAGGTLDLGSVLAQLAERGITRLMVEGGPSVARAFLDADLVDEAVLFVGHAPAGSTGLMPFVSEGLDRLRNSRHFTCLDRRDVGQDRRFTYRRME